MSEIEARLVAVRIGPQDSFVQPLEPEGRVKQRTVRLRLQPDAGAVHQEAVDAVARAQRRRVAGAEIVRIPGVDPGLVLGLDGDGQPREVPPHPFVDTMLRFGRQVGGVEVEQVVVADAGLRRPSALQVPDALEQAAGHQPGIGQRQRRQAGEERAVVRVAQRVLDEAAGQGRAGRTQRTLAMLSQT